MEDAIRDYLAGEGSETVGHRHHIDPNRLVRILRERGLLRDRATRYTFMAERHRGRRLKELPIGDAELARRYLAGESEKALAAAMGVERSMIRPRLLAAGVQPRGRSESMYIRMAGTTPEERLRLTSAAHDAVRGVRRDPRSVRAMGLSRALTLQSSMGVRHPVEDRVAILLRALGVRAVEQYAVETYNLDFAIPPVAVEVHVGTNHPLGVARLRRRTEYLTDRGWHVFYVWLARYTSAVWPSLGEDLVAFLEAAQRDPSPIGQYRVVRGSGELVTSGRGDLHELAVVPASVG